jgi:hypothetical protein
MAKPVAVSPGNGLTLHGRRPAVSKPNDDKLMGFERLVALGTEEEARRADSPRSASVQCRPEGSKHAGERLRCLELAELCGIPRRLGAFPIFWRPGCPYLGWYNPRYLYPGYGKARGGGKASGNEPHVQIPKVRQAKRSKFRAERAPLRQTLWWSFPQGRNFWSLGLPIF